MPAALARRLALSASGILTRRRMRTPQIDRDPESRVELRQGAQEFAEQAQAVLPLLLQPRDLRPARVPHWARSYAMPPARGAKPHAGGRVSGMSAAGGWAGAPLWIRF